jgi:hypothetical protein
MRPAVVLGVAAVSGACDSFSNKDGAPVTLGTGGAGNVGGASGAGGSSVLPQGGAGGSLVLPPSDPPCAIASADTPVFGEHVFDYANLFRRELYSWTTDEQIAELREGEVLLTRTEREGLGPGYAFDVIAGIAEAGDEAINQLAAYLSGDAFATARYAWPQPWATRMGWPGESYGNNLLRIVLREDAWLVAVANGTLRVFDAQANTVPLQEALATPERIAVIFFEKDHSAGGPICGSFVGGGNGYREFIVGNEAMIEEWSVATADILQKLESDLQLLEQFLERIRDCPPGDDPVQWNLNVCCSWGFGAGVSEQAAYEQSLAMPSPYYLPAPAEMVALIETLESARFEPDPLIVYPGN